METKKKKKHDIKALINMNAFRSAFSKSENRVFKRTKLNFCKGILLYRCSWNISFYFSSILEATNFSYEWLSTVVFFSLTQQARRLRPREKKLIFTD